VIIKKEKNSMTIEGCCHFPKRCFGKVNPYFDRVSLYLDFIYHIFVASDSCCDWLLRAAGRGDHQSGKNVVKPY
jgi:hypothetical protein